MKKIKTILKAFVLIVLPAFLTIGGIFAVVPVAQMAMGGISHPLMGFPAVIMMIPWGIMFIIIFNFGVGTMRTAFEMPTIGMLSPIPSFAIYSHGQGAYSVTSGKGRGGGMVLAIIKFVISIPFAVIVWIIVSIILLFSRKMEDRIDDAFEEFTDDLKTWYKWGVLLFIIFPLIVVGFNSIENTVYSPKNIEFNVTEFKYTGQDTYKPIEYFKLSYTIDLNGEDITEIKGEWQFINKKTGDTYTSDAWTFVPYNWRWENEDKNIEHRFNTTISVPTNNEEYNSIFSNGLEDIKIICKINYISFDSNIPILGDFMFPTIDNEYKDGYLLTVKP